MIRKALLPVAGYGRRMGPLARVVPKALFPLVDAQGQVRPIIHHILREAFAGGVEQIGLIAAPWQTEVLGRYLAAADNEFAPALSRRLEIILQPAARGLGDAVLCGKDFAGDEPFMLLLGDHVRIPRAGDSPCTAQVAEAFARTGGMAMVGMYAADAEQTGQVGVARGEMLGDNVYRCTGLMEKPDPQTARRHLVTEGLPAGRILAHCGVYVFTKQIFSYLEQLCQNTVSAEGEVELTDAQTMLLEEHPTEYYLFRTTAATYDTGMPDGYLAAQVALRQASGSLGVASPIYPA